MAAWRDGDPFIVEFDLPGVDPDSLNLDVERSVLTVRAERPDVDQDRKMVTAERPRGVFSRQLFLGENLDAERITAGYRDGVLRLTIPVAEKAKPRRIEISHGGPATEINARAVGYQAVSVRNAVTSSVSRSVAWSRCRSSPAG